MRILALIASIGVAAQIVVTLFSGSGICPTQGCRIVESLTRIQPLWINLLGLLFFQAVFWSPTVLKEKNFFSIDPVGILLLGGLTFDGVLLAYQIFVVRTFCLYCLLVFAVVLILNIIYSRKQTIRSLTALAVILSSFSILSFASGTSQMVQFSLNL